VLRLGAKSRIILATQYQFENNRKRPARKQKRTTTAENEDQ